VPSENIANRLPSDALEAFLDGILAELRDPTDPVALNEIRSAFRKRVPFNLRSYAAAALILRAAGLSRASGRPMVKEPLVSPKAQQKGLKDREPSMRAARQSPKDARTKSEEKASETSRANEAERKSQPPRPRYIGEGVTLFFSMGKRQRLYPRILIDLVIDIAGLAPESIGEVRAFDNYSFADIDPQWSAAVISALDGYEFRGRKLSVGPAKKRDGQTVEGF
jgi:hypothetical protein